MGLKSCGGGGGAGGAYNPMYTFSFTGANNLEGGGLISGGSYKRRFLEKFLLVLTKKCLNRKKPTRDA